MTGTVDLGAMLITEAGRESLKAGIGYVINNPISAANSVKESIGKEVTEFKEAPWVGENSRLEKGGYIAGDIAMLLVRNKGIGNAGKAAGISSRGAKGARGIIRAENIGHKIEKSLIEKEFRKSDIEQITKSLGKNAERKVKGNVHAVSIEEIRKSNLTDVQKSRLKTLRNTVDDHLKEKDFTGTLADLKGEPISKKNGGYYNHLNEMENSYVSLKKISISLERSLKNLNLSNFDRKLLQRGLDEAKHYIARIEELLNVK